MESGKRNRCDSCGKIARFGARIDGISVNFFHNYKRSALRRGLEFSIDLQYVSDLFKAQDARCALSGIPLTIKGSPWKGQTGSLDRIDPSKGYIKGNVQWVHKRVNELKWDFNQKELLLLVKHIYEYKQLNEIAEEGEW